jgi:hypothetical protein
VVFDLIGRDAQKRPFLVLKEGGHLVFATQPVSKDETAINRVSGRIMRLAPSGDGLGKIERLLEEHTPRHRDRIRAPGCGASLEGHRLEPATGSWDVAQWGSGET